MAGRAWRSSLLSSWWTVKIPPLTAGDVTDTNMSSSFFIARPKLLTNPILRSAHQATQKLSFAQYEESSAPVEFSGLYCVVKRQGAHLLHVWEEWSWWSRALVNVKENSKHTEDDEEDCFEAGTVEDWWTEVEDECFDRSGSSFSQPKEVSKAVLAHHSKVRTVFMKYYNSITVQVYLTINIKMNNLSYGWLLQGKQTREIQEMTGFVVTHGCLEFLRVGKLNGST